MANDRIMFDDGTTDTAVVAHDKPLPVAIYALSGGNGSVQTSATGATYVALTSQAAKRVTLFNNSGTALEVRQGGSGVAVPVASAATFTFEGLANANELSVRRVDVSNTQVTAVYRWEA
jgi:hypothetical protein